MREVVTWSPFRSLGSLRRDMDDLFNRFFNDWERDFSPWFQHAGGDYLPVESYVDGNTLVIKADLPGVDAKDIQVSVEGNQLTIKAERKTRQEHKQRAYFRKEVRDGSFTPPITLP